MFHSTLHIELQPPFTERLLLKGNIGCAGSPTMNIEIANDPTAIGRIYESYFAQLGSGDVSEAFRQEIASNLLNVPEGVLDNS